MVVACGHTATVGWLRSRTDTFHSDVHLLEAAAPAAAATGGPAGASPGGLRWVALSAGGVALQQVRWAQRVYAGHPKTTLSFGDENYSLKCVYLPAVHAVCMQSAAPTATWCL